MLNNYQFDLENTGTFDVSLLAVMKQFIKQCSLLRVKLIGAVSKYFCGLGFDYGIECQGCNDQIYWSIARR